jgi:hypothetical protein
MEHFADNMKKNRDSGKNAQRCGKRPGGHGDNGDIKTRALRNNQ